MLQCCTRIVERRPSTGHWTGVKPWPNGPRPNSSQQLEPRSQLRWSWVSFGHSLGLSWLELARIKSSSNFRPTPAKFSTAGLATSATLTKLFCYCYVTTRSYSDNLNGFLQSGWTWQYRLATPRWKFWFRNLARVGLSWGYRLARALPVGISHKHFQTLRCNLLENLQHADWQRKSVLENSAQKMIPLPILNTSLVQSSLKGWENVLFELERAKSDIFIQLSRFLAVVVKDWLVER